MAYDPTEEIAALRDDVDKLDQTFGKAAQAARTPVTEYDRTGAVTVELDADGVLQKVSIAGGWSRHYQPSELGGAVQQAMTAAGVARANAWGETLGNAREPGSVRPAPTLDSALGVKLDEAQARGVDTDRALVELRDLLRELNEAVDTVTEQTDAHLASEFRGRSSSGHVSATVSGSGDLLTVDFEQPWVETAHPTNLGRETTEAVTAAQQQQLRSGTDAIIAASPLAEAGRLSADPQALLRRLRIG